jgi:threonine synthase
VVRKRPRIAVAQAARANPFARAFRTGFSDLSPIVAGGTLATAIQIGNPVSLRRAIRVLRAFDGVVEDATESELADAAARADRDGAFCCPQTGVALAVAEKLVARDVIRPGSEVAVVSTAHGLKFAEVKQAYHASALADVSPRWANPPVQVPATTSAVLQVLRDRLDRPGTFG